MFGGFVGSARCREFPKSNGSRDVCLSGPGGAGAAGFPAVAAAAAAACAAKSFFDAFPRFFLSRAYSQVKPNSVAPKVSTHTISCFPKCLFLPKMNNLKVEKSKKSHTNTMGAWRLAITLGPQLVALVAGTTDSSPDWSGRRRPLRWTRPSS